MIPVEFEHKTFISVAVDELTDRVLDRFETKFLANDLCVQKELRQLSANIAVSKLDGAIAQMLDYAVARTPKGGHINVTLLDKKHCWELEVANSATTEFQKRGAPPAPETIDSGAVDFGDALDAATYHGGKFKSCNCPLGGTANVLIIPQLD